MSPANERRRNVMLTAWSFRRADLSRPFSDCLRGAWAFLKRVAAAADTFMAKARKAGGQVRLSPSLIRSPLGRKLGYGSRADWHTAYTTAAFGG